MRAPYRATPVAIVRLEPSATMAWNFSAMTDASMLCQELVAFRAAANARTITLRAAHF